MKILVINFEYPPLGGGGGVATKKCAEGWARAGHQVTVVTSRGKGLPADRVENGVRVLRAPVLRTAVATANLPSMALYNPMGLLTCLTAGVDFDVISTHFSIPSGPLGHFLSHLKRVPNVLTVYGADIYDPTRFSPKDNFLLKRINVGLLNGANALVAESNDIGGKAREYYGISRDIEVIPLPYSPISFNPVSRIDLGLEENIYYLIAVGRLVRRKGFHNLIEAFAADTACDRELLILGEGPERERLRQLAVKHGVSDRVHFLGYQSDERKFQYLNCADLFVLSSEHEGFGIVLQEAMQVGLPIVSTNVGGQTDFLANGKNALLVAPDRPDLIKCAIDAVASSSTLQESMRQKNRSDIVQFNEEIICHRYLDIFTGVTY